jgi:hypothetical protein
MKPRNELAPVVVGRGYVIVPQSREGARFASPPALRWPRSGGRQPCSADFVGEPPHGASAVPSQVGVPRIRGLRNDLRYGAGPHPSTPEPNRAPSAASTTAGTTVTPTTDGTHPGLSQLPQASSREKSPARIPSPAPRAAPSSVRTRWTVSGARTSPVRTCRIQDGAVVVSSPQPSHMRRVVAPGWIPCQATPPPRATRLHEVERRPEHSDSRGALTPRRNERRGR